MIIPEVINSNLTYKNLINEFEILINNKNNRNFQLESINYNLFNIESDKSPYEISAKRILSLI